MDLRNLAARVLPVLQLPKTEGVFTCMYYSYSLGGIQKPAMTAGFWIPGDYLPRNASN